MCSAPGYMTGSPVGAFGQRSRPPALPQLNWFFVYFFKSVLPGDILFEQRAPEKIEASLGGYCVFFS